MIKIFLATAEAYPEAIAFHYSGDKWNILTYKAFSHHVRATAAYLVSEGLCRGDRIAIIAENRPEWCAAYLGIIMAGGTAVPIDAQLGRPELVRLLVDSGSKIVFCSNETAGKIAGPPDLQSSSSQKAFLLINFDSLLYDDVLSSGATAVLPEEDPGDIASLIYTSGTTGRPKGVMLTHKNFCSDAEALINAGLVSHQDNVLSVLPLHHTYAFMCTFLVPVLVGASITYPASLKGPDLISAINGRGVTIVIGVPQLLGMIRNGLLNKIQSLPAPLSYALLRMHRLAGMLRRRFGMNMGPVLFKAVHSAFGKQFRFFASGGARLDPSIMKDLEAFGFTVLEGYGLTETSPVVTFNPFSKRKPGSAGIPLPSVGIRIHDPSETGEGEVLIKGPMVMKGYYQNPAATADVFQGDWLRSGDIGRLDEDGYLFLTGRLKEVIVLSSGKNIYPEDMENIYQESPLIKEVCIVGTGDPEKGESLHAVIVPDLDYAKRSEISNIQEEMKWEINRLSSLVPSAMRITGYSIRTEPLPRTRLGKLRRFLVKAGPVGEEVRTERAQGDSVSGIAEEPVRGIIDELRHFTKEEQLIRGDDHLELDLGLDSLSKIELAAALEKRFSVLLPEDLFTSVHTVQDLIEKLKGSPMSSPGPETADKPRWRHILATAPSDADLSLISHPGEDKMMLLSLLLFSLFTAATRLFFRLEAKGVGNIPLDQPFVLAPNHTSYLDGGVVILSLPFSFFRRIYTLGLSEFFTGPLRSRLAKLAHIIPIDAASFLSKALQIAAHIIKNNHSLTVFPEGGRSFDGELLEFKKGVGILAVELGVPVVPVWIEGAYSALPRTARIPKPSKITVVFGSPLRMSDLDFSRKSPDLDEYQYFSNILREKVRELGMRNASGMRPL